MRGLAVALGTILLLVAGCLSGNGSETAPEFDAQWSVRALPSGAGHDHTDPAAHLNATTPNFEVLGFNPLTSPFYGTSPGGLHCGDARPVEDGRRLAVAESRSKVGFTLADVTDPLDPRYLGEMVMEGTIIKDITITPDGRYVVAVTLAQTPSDWPEVPVGFGHARSVGPLVAEWRPCGGAPVPVAGPSDPVARPRSILLIDITDPATPAIVDHQPLSGEGHSVAAFDFDGATLILTSVYLSPLAYMFQDIVETPAGGKLRTLSQYVPETVTPDALQGDVVGGGFGSYSHDGWIAKHPVTGEWLAYLAALDVLEIVNVDDPVQPRLVGSWTDKVPGREGYSGIIHSVEPLHETWDGHHYTVIGPEPGTHPVDHPTGIVWVLDTTNPGAPFEVAAWTLPHEVDWEDFGFLFANHYFTVHERTLLISMYHGGIWAIDLSPVGSPGFTLLDSVGVFLPADPTLERSAFEDSAPQAPSLEEVLHLGDGTFVTFDNSYGLYTFRYHAEWPAPAPEPWPIEPVSKR
jgi:hypothetical protein